ncbi:prolyl oligopeptidase family serine peptidase [Stenotrophomonas sp. MYb238]|uniref:alpha/beta hydrolase n=1 Tax=Stenotrophomonas sp. MYb238 TaxID=2040281 RepID=UPI0012922DE8|nr:alpha/beta hydrolase [Stenotrophomonas sp. MYb238]MQP77197.1 prolyl oligopeptidase family serine peptidase [Stenotrophomonas sp. MYb238]
MSTQQAIAFRNRTWDVAATLRLPEGFDPGRKYAAIVCAHPISSCKEQTSGALYGEALTREGFITLAFDASTQGASGGEPRYSEDPATRVEDFRCAVDYLVTLPYVDEERIGVLGVCGGGGYAVSAAMTERRFKAVGTVVAANYGRLMREGDMSPDAAIRTLDAIAAQRTAEARGAEPLVVGYIPGSEAERAQAGLDDIDIVEAVQYYTTPRGRQPGSPNRLRFSSTAAAVGWDAFHLAEVLLTQPLHIVIGSVPGGFGSYRDGFELHRRARSQHKSLQIVAGASHYDLYDKPEATGQALAQLVPFYRRHLGV